MLHLGLETAAGKHSFRMMPRQARSISARLNSVLDKADARAAKAAGGAR
jgi:hypothetical protein